MSDFVGSPQAELAELYLSPYTVFVKRLSASVVFQPHMTGPTTGTWPLSGPKNFYKN